MERTPSTLGEMVRRRRRGLGMSQRELALQAGLSLRAVRNIELGRVRQPHPRSVRGLADVLRLADSEMRLLPTGGAAARSGPRVRVRVLGPLVVSRGPEPVEVTSAGARSLLGLLAVQPGRLVSVDEIVDIVWGPHPPPAWRQSVHHYVWQLRGLLEPGRQRRAPAAALVRTRGGYLLELGAEHLDIVRFTSLADQARQVDAAREPQRAVRLWAEALGCWRGPVLANLGAALRQHPAAVAVAGRRLAAALAHADLAFALGRWTEAVERLRPVAADEPLHEAVHARLMIALAGRGEQAAALDVFGRIRARLAEELGIEPGPEVQQAHLRVLRGEVWAAGPEGRRIGFDVPGRWVPPAQLPPDAPGFAGRSAQVAELDALLERRGRAGPVLITAIGGTAGVGKTALAVHWAHRVADRFADGQLYANLHGFDPSGQAMDPAEALRGFLTALGVPPERLPAAVEAQVGLYRSLLARRRVLVLLDNARDADQVRPLLPGAPGCLTVVTSRNQLSGLVATEAAHPLSVRPLAADQARTLLAARLGKRRIAAEPGAVDEIVRRCAGLPLALAIAAARAATHPDLPLAALAAELRGALDAFDGGDTATDIRVVFSWSYDALSSSAARLFRLLSVHPGADFQATAAASLAGLPRRDVRRLLAELTTANLITEQHSTEQHSDGGSGAFTGRPGPATGTAGSFTFHDLLRAYAAEQAQARDAAADRDAALVRVLDHYLHTAHAATLLINPHQKAIELAEPAPGVTVEEIGDGDRALAWFAAVRPVLLAAVGHAARAGLDAHTCQLAWALSLFLDRQGHWHDLLTTQHAALAAARRRDDPAGQAYAERDIGAAHLELGRLDDAQAHYQNAIALFGRAGDADGRAYAHLGTAIVADRQGHHDSAVRHAEQARELFEATGNRAGQAHALTSVAWYLVTLGDYPQAITSCRRALAVQQELGDRYGEANSWDNLGYAYHHLGDYAEAVACFRRALDLFAQTGGRHSAVWILTHLGDTHRAAGAPAAAREAWQQALDILVEMGHPDADDLRAKLADLDSAGAQAPPG